ncbi:MAG: AzlD domain-containing protein [Calothrix sp. FI2-JRJ7]|jgi:branched-subunit amino acid transport protein|nr:AzlD domain-containing protein [Calothrix sp. FI2-JRJ7]
MNEFPLILGMTLVTFIIRYPILGVSARIKMAPQFIQVLRYVPPAVLTAIITPAVLISTDDKIDIITNPRLIGAIAALIVGIWRQNLLLTISVGMIVFLICQLYI